MSKNDIYVRGWGAVTTLGWSAQESAKKLIEGKIAPAKVGDSSHFISREYKSFEVPYTGSPLDKSQKMLACAMDEAIARAEFSRAEIAESSLFVGTTGGLFIRNEDEFAEEVRLNPSKESPPISCRNRGPGEVTQLIADKYGIKGIAFTFSMACVSSSHALVGGCDVFTPTIEESRERMNLTTDNSRLLPVGEGSSWLLLGGGGQRKIGDILAVHFASPGEDVLTGNNLPGMETKGKYFLPGFRVKEKQIDMWKNKNNWQIHDYLPCCGIHPVAAAFGIAHALQSKKTGYFLHYNFNAAGRPAFILARK